MGKPLITGMLPLAAGLVLLTGLVLASRALREMRVTAGHIEDKVLRLQELHRIRDGKTAAPASVAAFESLSTQQPPNLSAMLEQLLSGIDFEYTESVPVAAGSAWLLREAEVKFESVPLPRLAEVIGRAESERPPWRVRDCLIEAGGDQPGQGRVTLKLEALHKEDI